ncbi:transcriptional regulatory protein rtcR [Rhodopirellula maiorica SM1]|uniref:Transcriptional regulatory protein rtcR n=1 Tax=Rhodopirellula maiorica SM1 TaxID=1265738 RepID=M5S4L4_9BACT|nr:RNA repair transcriptional activator RtcR [Rhodopirellula maiorica]EMI21129.1 transcriptional regulatory protein rtcR [Rhodopirellula maiorica SM1]
MDKSRVVIGFLGTQLDQSAKRGDRWSGWRPSIAVCQQPDLVVDRFELLCDRRHESLAADVAADMGSVSPETDVCLHWNELRDPWDFEEVYAMLHQFTRDYSFDTDSEQYLAHITTGTHVAQICLFLLTESRHLPAALLQTSPAKRGSKDARGIYSVIDLDLSRYDQLASRFQAEHQEGLSFLKSGIETKNKAFNQLIERIEQVSLATRAPILLSGPTGAGKSQLAQRIFALKRHRQQVAGPLVEVNCATIRGEQAMSTLFGHIKGAFTGAAAARSGLLKTADRGVLFLDEIGELGSDEQAMLLRAIEEKTFLAVGSDVATSSDFQLIAGTNRDLQQEVAKGNFREDLLARINLWSFSLPGLAQRRDDIDPNIDFELQKFTTTHGRKVTFNKEARNKFVAFAHDPATHWKANFRDLNAAITRMATLAPGGRITTEVVDEEITRLKHSWHGSEKPDSHAATLRTVLDENKIAQMDRFDQAALAEVIKVCWQSASLSAAGRELFQVSRQSKQKANDADRLRKYLGKFGIKWSDIAR